MTIHSLLPLLAHIQLRLDTDLSLDALAARAGLSPHHFHRLFRGQIGETPKQYVLRLRLERAAFQLLVHDATVLEVSLSCGFRNHESFTRAFGKHFGMAPSEYRPRVRNPGVVSREEVTGCSLSRTTVRAMRPLSVAFVRHVGPYEAVPDTLWDELIPYVPQGNLHWVGIGHDAPGITSPEQLRFDAGVLVSAPLESRGRIGYQQIPGGLFAFTTHIGPYSTLPRAYEVIFQRLVRMTRRYRIIGLPCVEFYHATRVNAQCELNHTDICIPVEARVI